MPTPAWPITVTRCGRSSFTTRPRSELSNSDSSSRPIRGVAEREIRVGVSTVTRTASHA